MRNARSKLTAAVALVAVIAASGSDLAAHPPDPDGPPRHLRHGAKHPQHSDPARFVTSRDGAPLALPAEDEAFTFVVFGDRTGGPAEGVEVLADAVRDVNLLEPDLVMTVGDLVEGYGPTGAWMDQMREFRGIMDGLLCPWFPVAGNHDTYWRGPDRLDGEHDAHYEMHFGPLWYAFEHKGCWFVVLYSDEGDPATGIKSFNEPAAQRMSDEQLAWLEETLEHAAGAQHVFVFLHHPRWLGGGYGDDWQRVHECLAAAGNVRAVFAGHIHRMRYDGVRDGIEYVTLATTGGGQSGVAPEAGYLHHFHVVTVRPRQIAMAALPVGDVIDVRGLTGTVSDETRRLAGTPPRFGPRMRLGHDGALSGELTVSVTNPVSRPIEVTLGFDGEDPRWLAVPDHRHDRIEPGETRELRFGVQRAAGPLDGTFRPLRITRQMDYLGERARYALPPQRLPIPLTVDIPRPPTPEREHVLVLDGDGDALEVPSDALAVPDGPLTVECWFNADRFDGRTGLVSKAEQSEYGLFVSDAAPAFYVFIGDRYVELIAAEKPLQTGRWHHVAGVYDGAEARLYVDGTLRASRRRAGVRRRNELPLYVGGDVDGAGRLTSAFDGAIDTVRISTAARYRGAEVAPRRRFEPDERTALLLEMDGGLGPWVYDGSPHRAHPVRIGDARLAPAEASP